MLAPSSGYVLASHDLSLTGTLGILKCISPLVCVYVEAQKSHISPKQYEEESSVIPSVFFSGVFSKL